MPFGWVIIFVAIVIAGSPSHAKEFRSSDIYPYEYPTVQAVIQMDKLVRERTKTRLRIDPIGFDDRNSETFLVAQVRAGMLDMARINLAVLSRTVPSTIVPTLPFLLKSTEHMRSVLDGPIGQEILASLEAQGLVGLCFYDSGPRSLYSVKRPIRRAADLKGMKIRVQQSDIWANMMRALGAEPVTMPQDRVLIALQSGVIDASESDWSSFVTTGHYRVAKHFSVTEHAMSPGVLVFSKRVWDELSTEDQGALRGAAKDSVRTLRRLQDDAEASSRSMVEASGIDIVGDIDKKSFVDAMLPLYPLALENARVRSMVSRVQAGQ
ncbi:MAG: TRAP transporter substrate-binding protein [Reyranellaceae bacterium]